MTDNRNALSSNPTRRRYSVAIALGVALLAVMAVYSPASANQTGYEPPVEGGPARTQGSGTR